MNRQHTETLLFHFRQVEKLRAEALNLVSIDLTAEQLCDLELLLNRGLYPLEGYMNHDTYNSVLHSMRLPDGTIWPIPVCLSANRKLLHKIGVGQRIALNDQEGFLLAILTINDIWQPDKVQEAQLIYGTTDPTAHPGVRNLFNCHGNYYIGGSLEGVSLPIHYDFQSLRLTPSETARHFTMKGWRRVIGFQTEEYLHCGHREMVLAAAREIGAAVFVQPLVDLSHSGKLAHYTQVRCHQAFTQYFPANMIELGLMPLASRKAGPKEALWQAIIRKNFGCSHFIVADDHADPFAGTGVDDSTLFYPKKEAQNLVEKYISETGIAMIPAKAVSYSHEEKKYFFTTNNDVEERSIISSRELMNLLVQGEQIPEWLCYPEIVEELQHDFPPRSQQGFTIFMTGFSGSGKSTIAKVLQVKFMEMRDRPVTLLDGDVVRLNLSSELTFSKEHRNLNITRIGFVASEITKNGGIALCAPIAPYEESRQANRALISRYGGYIEVHVATPLAICEQRDRKGLYAKARAGLIQGVTGITDPYITPIAPDLTIDTTDITPMEAVQEILLYLENEGYLNN